MQLILIKKKVKILTKQAFFTYNKVIYILYKNNLKNVFIPPLLLKFNKTQPQRNNFSKSLFNF